MTRDIFPGLVSNIASNVALFTINKFQRRIKGKGAVRGGKGSTVIYCNKSLEDLGVLIDGVAESVKHEIKKKQGGFLGGVLPPLAASLVQPAISSVVKGVTWKRGQKSSKRIFG